MCREGERCLDEERESRRHLFRRSILCHRDEKAVGGRVAATFHSVPSRRFAEDVSAGIGCCSRGVAGSLSVSSRS